MQEPLEKRATTFIEQVRRFVALLRYGSRELVLALCGFTFLAAAPALARLPKGWLPPRLEPWLTLPFWLAGSLCLALAAIRIYRQVSAPLLQGESRLPALKGAASFTSSDAELFVQLGRGDELEQLRAWIVDDQKPFIVLMGESGAGKTSLLRAGLAHTLGDTKAVTYWEALPTEPAEGLLHAVRAAWGETPGTPVDLAALPAAIGGSPRVLILDQFEQLSPAANPEIFNVLRKALHTPPPYRGTWIIAFRREYAADWVDFTLGLPESDRIRVETLSLKLFSVPTARRIVSVLASQADLPVDQTVVNELVAGIAIDDHVSPVDIGVSLLGLHELTSPDDTVRISLRDFRESGGSSGLLRRYLEQVLSLVPASERSPLVVALLALIDLDSNQRVAEGLSLETLIAKARPFSTDRFQNALQFLASGKARVLEMRTDPAGVPRYRLLHERFIEPLRMLSGVFLAAAAQAALRLDEAYRTWSLRNRRRRFLLYGSELRLISRYRRQVVWGEDEAGKRELIRRSLRNRWFRRVLMASACIAFVAISIFEFIRIEKLKNENLRRAQQELRQLKMFDDKLIAIEYQLEEQNRRRLPAPPSRTVK
jgi:hypothetical protein